MTYPYSPNEILLMDGASTPPKDLISGTAFTMAGTPATATVLGATAPTFGAGAYTAGLIANPVVAAVPITFLCAIKTAAYNTDFWYFLNIGSDAANNQGRALVWNGTLYAGFGNKTATMAVNATNWGAGTHIVIGTISAAGTVSVYLDGNKGTDGTGATMGTVATNARLATDAAGSNPLTGSILCAIWQRTLTATEITALSSLTAWSSLTTPVATGSGRIGTGGNRLSHARYLGA